MANGVAAALPLLAPELPSAPAKATTPDVPIELTLGMAVADAVTALSLAMSDYQRCGMLAPTTREAGGSRIAKVAELQLGHEFGDCDFASRARAAGKATLRQYFNADFYQYTSPAAVEAELDALITEVLAIAGKVVRDERALAN
jgi:hypothetical protein